MNTTHHRHFEHHVSESKYISLQDSGVDNNFEKLETVGFPTHNFQEPQVKFRSPNLFLTIRPAPPGKSSWCAIVSIGVSGHNIANVEVDFYMLHSVMYVL